MRDLLPFNVCLVAAALGLFLLQSHPLQAPVLITSLAALGLLFILRRHAFARASIRQHNAFWGFALDERAVRAARVLAVVVGLSCLGLAVVFLGQMLELWP